MVDRRRREADEAAAAARRGVTFADDESDASGAESEDDLGLDDDGDDFEDDLDLGAETLSASQSALAGARIKLHFSASPRRRRDPAVFLNTWLRNAAKFGRGRTR